MSKGYKDLGVSRIISFLLHDPNVYEGHWSDSVYIMNGSLHEGSHGPVHQYGVFYSPNYKLFEYGFEDNDSDRDFYGNRYYNNFYSTTEDFRIKDSIFGSNDKYAMVSPEKTWLDSDTDYHWHRPDDVISSTEWKSRGLTDDSKYSIDNKGNVVDIGENIFYTTFILTSDNIIMLANSVMLLMTLYPQATVEAQE